MPGVEHKKGTVTASWSNIGFSAAPSTAAVVASANYGSSDYSSYYDIKVRYYGGAWQWCISGSSGSVTAAAVACWTS